MDFLDTVVLAYKNTLLAITAIDDENHPLHDTFMKADTKQVEEWRSFIADCKNYGVQLLVRESN